MVQRLRIIRFLLVPVVLLAVFSHHVYPEDSVWDTLLGSTGLAFLSVAMVGRVWASAYIAGRKDRRLVTDGPYRFVRHPLYLFSLLGFLGAGLAFESLTLAGLLALIFFVGHLPAIRAEERKLRHLFGKTYEEYQGCVPLLVPSIRSCFELRQRRKSLVLDVPRFSSALRDALAIPLVFIVADLLEWAKVGEVLPVIILLP